MNKYIKADGLLLLIKDYLNIPRFNNDYDAGVQKVQKMIEVYPAADVEEVRHGKWIFVDGYVTCSECGARPFRFLNRFDFEEIDTFKGCPHCRAKMDGKEKTDGET